METNFLDNLGGNSLDRVELAMALEEAFNTGFSDEEVDTIRNFRTVKEVQEYLRKRGKGGD